MIFHYLNAGAGGIYDFRIFPWLEMLVHVVAIWLFPTRNVSNVFYFRYFVVL
jgi:hypothetical protein